MDPNRTAWNNRQKELKACLSLKEPPPDTIDLFLRQHAAVHYGEMTGSVELTFDDELWENLSAEKARRITTRSEHSIVWMIWHMARCEDITMTLLVGGIPQVLDQGWREQIRATVRDTGNSMTPDAVKRFSDEVDIPALHAYRSAVGQQTRSTVIALSNIQAQLGNHLRRKVNPTRIQQVIDQGDVLDDTRYLTEYWGAQTVAGLLLMPATRHPFVHYNEALKVKLARD